MINTLSFLIDAWGASFQCSGQNHVWLWTQGTFQTKLWRFALQVLSAGAPHAGQCSDLGGVRVSEPAVPNQPLIQEEGLQPLAEQWLWSLLQAHCRAALRCQHSHWLGVLLRWELGGWTDGTCDIGSFWVSTPGQAFSILRRSFSRSGSWLSGTGECRHLPSCAEWPSTLLTYVTLGFQLQVQNGIIQYLCISFLFRNTFLTSITTFWTLALKRTCMLPSGSSPCSQQSSLSTWSSILLTCFYVRYVIIGSSAACNFWQFLPILMHVFVMDIPVLSELGMR